MSFNNNSNNDDGILKDDNKNNDNASNTGKGLCVCASSPALLGNPGHPKQKKRRKSNTLHQNVHLLHQTLPDTHLPQLLNQNQPDVPLSLRRTSLPNLVLKHPNFNLDSTLLREAQGILADLLLDASIPDHLANSIRMVNNIFRMDRHHHSRGVKWRGHRTFHPSSDLLGVSPANRINKSSDNLTSFSSDPLNSLSKVEEGGELRKNRTQIAIIPCTEAPPRFADAEEEEEYWKSHRSLKRSTTSSWTTTTSATGLPILEPYSKRHERQGLKEFSGESKEGERKTVETLKLLSKKKLDLLETSIKQRHLLTTPITSDYESSNEVLERDLKKQHKSLQDLASPEESNANSSDAKPLFSITKFPTNEADGVEGDDEEDNDAILKNYGIDPCIRFDELLTEHNSSDHLSFSINKSTNTSLSLIHVDSSENSLKKNLIPVENKTFFSPDLLSDSTQKKFMSHLETWDFPIFSLATEAPNDLLTRIAYRIFEKTGLLETFSIPLTPFLSFFQLVGLGYQDNLYHNRIHASDVLHAVYYMTSQGVPGLYSSDSMEDEIEPHISNKRDHVVLDEQSPINSLGMLLPPLELMALYTAAAIHDFDHPGRTNAFLVSSAHPMAVLYNDRSILENHHVASAWKLLTSNPSLNWLQALDPCEWRRFRFLLIEAVLATDLKKHFELVAEFNSKVNEEDSPGIDWTQETDRLIVINMVIKMADINGPCKSQDLHLSWTERIVKEFFEQGDEEKKLNLAISPFMDRSKPQVAKLQESFINHLVSPLCHALFNANLLPGEEDEDEEEEEEDINFQLRSFTYKKSLTRYKTPLMENLKQNISLWTSHIKAGSLPPQLSSVHFNSKCP